MVAALAAFLLKFKFLLFFGAKLIRSQLDLSALALGLRA